MNRKVLIRVSCSEHSDWSDATKRKGSEMFRQQKLNFFSTNWISFFPKSLSINRSTYVFQIEKIQICSWRISVKHDKQTASLSQPKKVNRLKMIERNNALKSESQRDAEITCNDGESSSSTKVSGSCKWTAHLSVCTPTLVFSHLSGRLFHLSVSHSASLSRSFTASLCLRRSCATSLWWCTL